MPRLEKVDLNRCLLIDFQTSILRTRERYSLAVHPQANQSESALEVIWVDLAEGLGPESLT